MISSNKFKGKIIISDFQELNRICSINGIIHILNTNTFHIPNEKIDCIITGKRNSELESKLISLSSESHILYTNCNENTLKKWCYYCHNLCDINDNNIIMRYCSEDCMNKYSKFMQNFKESTEDWAKRMAKLQRGIRMTTKIMTCNCYINHKEGDVEEIVQCFLCSAALGLLKACVAWVEAYENGELEKYDDAFKITKEAIIKATKESDQTNNKKSHNVRNGRCIYCH